MYLQKVSIANFLPSVLVYLCTAPVLRENVSSLLMSSEKKPTDLYLLVFHVSDRIKRSTWWKNINFLFDRFGFEIHQFGSSLRSGSRSGTVLISVQTKISLYLMYNRAGRIANAVDDNVPKSFVKSVIDLSCINNIS